jgi:hypothetical protein
MDANPHELRKEFRKNERTKAIPLSMHLSLPSGGSPPRASHSTPSSPALSDNSSNAVESDTFIPQPRVRQTTVQIDPIVRGHTDLSFSSSVSSFDLFRFVPNRVRLLPPNAILFVAGFLFFPCFWVGAFYPKLERKEKQPWRSWKRNSQAGSSVINEENLKRYSWRGQHEGVLPVRFLRFCPRG